jgi:hypothetical protein
VQVVTRKGPKTRSLLLVWGARRSGTKHVFRADSLVRARSAERELLVGLDGQSLEKKGGKEKIEINPALGRLYGDEPFRSIRNPGPGLVIRSFGSVVATSERTG